MKYIVLCLFFVFSFSLAFENSLDRIVVKDKKTEQVKKSSTIQKNRSVIEQFLKQEKEKSKLSIKKQVVLKEEKGKIKEESKVTLNPVLLEKDLKKHLDKAKVETSMIDPPPVPIIIPPKVVRILIYPYIDDKGNFHGPSYVFTEVKKARWVVGDYLPASSGFSSNSFTVLER